jgi:tetratricopeptide (TPR) repeat protein
MEATHSGWLFQTLMYAERAVGDHAALDEALSVALSKTESRAKQQADNGRAPEKDEYHRLARLLGKAELYASAGKLDRAQELVHEVVRALPTLQRSDQDELRQSLAFRQGEIGDGTGALATLRDLSPYYKKMSAEKDPEHSNPFMPYRHEVSLFLEMAQAQHDAGYTADARATIKEAIRKAEAIPGERDQDKLMRSNAFRMIVMSAAEMDEAQLALAAERKIRAESYQNVSGFTIMAVAKQGDVQLAHQLAKRYHCCGVHLAVGLSERGEWDAAVLALENPEYRCGCCDCRGGEVVQKARRVGSRALVHVRGVKKVLEDVAAEKQPKDKVEILLGILEAMNEKTASQVAHRSR